MRIYLVLMKCDDSAVQIFCEIVEAYKSRSVQVYFVRLREQPLDMFKKSGLLNLVALFLLIILGLYLLSEISQ